MALSWGVPPPPKPAYGRIHLLAVKAGQSVTCVKLGPQLGLFTHWCNGRTVPCLGDDCLIHSSYPLTWKGWVPVLAENWSWNGKQPGLFAWVLVTTEEIGADVDVLERGECFKVTRSGRKSNGPLSVDYLKGKRMSDPPATFDVRPYVLRVCGLPPGSIAKLQATG